MTAFCGCCFFQANLWQYLPQVSLNVHATIFSSAARTTLTQTFVNPSQYLLEEVSYRFPLYDGVSVVGFKVQVGTRVLHSKVKSKEQANVDYKTAVAQQATAAIMDQSSSENDIFIIRLGNVPAHEKITVDISFVGELKQDAQTDGIRYTIPNVIAPRYQNQMNYLQKPSSPSGVPASLQGISVTVDVLMEQTSVLRELHSPSHSIRSFLGRISSTPAEDSTFEPFKASATLHLAKGNVMLERDFVLVIKADGLDTPRALLESHPTIPRQQALMATLVPKFSLPPAKPEVVFVIDRSGSMGDKIATLQSALKVFLKSLPLGTCFNICSFGSHYSFLWPTSRVYDASSLQHALSFVDSITADMGGTEMQPAVEAAVRGRIKGKDLEVLILTDGQIINQQSLFNFVREAAADNTARFFSLGIGYAASHSLIEGIVRAGNGISQSVMMYEELDRKIVRMLKGALTPHIYDCKLEVEYDTGPDHDFELVGDFRKLTTDSETEAEDDGVPKQTPKQGPSQQPISVYDDNFKEPDMDLGTSEKADPKDLPPISPPNTIQAPYKIPTLYPFIRTTVYLLMDSQSPDRVPQSLAFSAVSKHGPLQLKIPIHDMGKGETIHQLASRKAVVELEEEHGWLVDAQDDSGNLFTQLHADTKQRLAARECQRLGIKFQVTGRYCSFVALEEKSSEDSTQTENQGLQEREVKQLPAESVGQPVNIGHGSLFGVQTQQARGGTHAGFGTATGGSSLFGGVSSGSVFGSASPGGGLFGAAGGPGKMKTISACAPAPPPPASGASLFGRFSGTASSGSSSFFGGAPSGGGLFGSAQNNLATSGTPFDRGSKPAPTKVHALVELQTFEGSWEWSGALFDLLGSNMGVTEQRLTDLLYDGGGSVEPSFLRGDEATVSATLLAMGFLVNKNADSKSLWELVYTKAEEWVAQKLAKMGTAGVILELHRSDIMTLA